LHTTTNRSLEGLRGAAALVVMFYHMGLLSRYSGIIENGYLAVDLFFVLSGYVICTAYGDALAGVSNVTRFVLRRVGRLWPLYIASAILYLAYTNVYALFPVAPDATTGETLANASISPLDVLAVATMANGFSNSGATLGSPVNWSAGDEFYVYLLFATICATLASRLRPVAFGVAAIVSYAAAIYLSVGRSHCLTQGECFNLAYGSGWTRCGAGFFAGCLLAEYNGTRIMKALRTRSLQLTVCAAALVFCDVSDWKNGIALAAPVVFFFLVASLLSDEGPVAAVLSSKPAQFLGRISYSLYLGHGALLPVYIKLVSHTANAYLRVAFFVVFLLGFFEVALLLHRHIEVPFRNRFYAWADTLPTLAAWKKTRPAAND
jgi:peptidoglycan/LPS O-acetylase OafA/YrhL